MLAAPGDPSHNWATALLDATVAQVVDPATRPTQFPTAAGLRDVLRSVEQDAMRTGRPVGWILARGPRGGLGDVGNAAEAILKALPGPFSGASFTSDSKEGMAPLLAGETCWHNRDPAAAVLLRDGGRWLHVLPPPRVAPEDAWKGAAGLKGGAAFRLWFDAAGGQWHLLHVAGREVAMELSGGPLDSPASEARVRAPALGKQAVARCRTVADLLELCVEHLGIRLRRLALARTSESAVQLRAEDGRPLVTADLDTVVVGTFYRMSDSDSPAGAALRRAIERSDPAAVRRALAAGASLELLPESHLSPLHLAIISFEEKRWFECVVALLDAGASISGDASNDPAVVAAVTWGRHFQEQRVRLLDELLRRGASVETPGTAAPHEGFRPLHIAAKEQQLDVVRFLLERGADPNAPTPHGHKAADLVGNNNRFDPEPTADRVRELLLAAENGATLPPPPPPPSAQPAALSLGQWTQQLGVLAQLQAWAEQNPSRVTPEVVAWVAHLAAPPTITLQPAPRAKFRAPAKVAALRAEMAKLGFEEAGVFKLPELGNGTMIGFVSPANGVYGALYEFGTLRVADVVRPAADGSMLTVTSSPVPPIEAPRPAKFRQVRLPGASPRQLLKALQAEPPLKAEPATVSAARFGPTVVAAYQALARHAAKWALQEGTAFLKAQADAAD